MPQGLIYVFTVISSLGLDVNFEKDIWYADAFGKKAVPRFDVYFKKGISAEGFDPTAVVIVGGIKFGILASRTNIGTEVYFTEKSCNVPSPPGSVTSVVEILEQGSTGSKFLLNKPFLAKLVFLLD